MTAIATRPLTINEDFVLGHYPRIEAAKKILGMLEERPRTNDELAKALGLSSRYMHFVLGTIGYLGFIGKNQGNGKANYYHLTEAGEMLHTLEGEEWETLWGTPLASSSAAYLMATEGKDAVIAFMVKRYGVTESNARVMALDVSYLMRYTKDEEIIAQGHPATRDESWDSLYISHGDRTAAKAEEKLSFCPTHFVSLPATGICAECEE